MLREKTRLQDQPTPLIRMTVAGALALAALVGCEQQKVADCDPGDRDWERQTFGVELPSAPAVDLAALPTDLIQAHYVGPYRMMALLIKGDYAGVQSYWREVEQMSDHTEQMRAVVRILDAFYERGLYALNMAQAWHAQAPDSPAAQMVLAAAWTHAASEASRTKYPKDAWGAHFFRVHDRVAQAIPLLNSLMTRKDVYGRAARELNLKARSMQPGGVDEAAWSHYLELVEFAPHYEWLYLRAAGFAANRRDEPLRATRFAQLQSLADTHALPQPHRLNLDQAIEAYVYPPAENPNPQAWRPYWEARVKGAPTIYNYYGWLEAEYAVHNWAGMVDVADKILALHPHHKRALELKSYALREMGESKAAYNASFEAMMVGSDWGINQIFTAYTRGGLGLPLKDYEAMYAHCQLGANLGLAGAANCMGAAHTDGFAGVERDDRKALAWHFLGARGGHANSVHDVAVLLPRVVRDPALAADINMATGHWIRKAANVNHTAAVNKLAARPDWGGTCAIVDDQAWAEWAFRVLKAVLF
jgi:hypothetical protein